MDDAVGRIATGKTDIASVARRGEQTGGQLGGMVWEGPCRCGGFVGGSEPEGCVKVVAVALLGKVALGFKWETGTAVA